MTLHYTVALLLLLFSFTAATGQTNDLESCTIGVASGSATADGRPLLWKTRDSSSSDNEVVLNTSHKYKYIGVFNADDPSLPWMGVNEYGFSIINSLIYDLPYNSSGPGNGGLMRDVLGNCRTVAEFQHYLDSTNITGRATHANFGVIDTTGAAVIYETGGNTYYKYNADDTQDGYIVRTNFTLAGGGSSGIERYMRSSELIGGFAAGDSLNYRSIVRYQMRDFSDEYSEPVPVPFPSSWSNGMPFGYIYCDKSICRPSSVSAAVIHGILPTERAGLTTMWTLLGQPAATVAVPYWPVGPTPDEADGVTRSPLCDRSQEIRAILFDYASGEDYIDSYKLSDGAGNGLWSCLFPLEDSVFNAAGHYLDSIRTTCTLPADDMTDREEGLAAVVLSALGKCKNSIILKAGDDYRYTMAEIYPNPATDRICIGLPDDEVITVKIFTLSGVKVLQCCLSGSGVHEKDISSLSRGVYIIQITGQEMNETRLLIKN